mmetsp:Transcript_49375/g.117463  ORF Transcript_49375/g.117463 Transcript_49375/m.117463 type:complete len:213 (-) Transcript_49375:89-727(-)
MHLIAASVVLVSLHHSPVLIPVTAIFAVCDHSAVLISVASIAVVQISRMERPVTRPVPAAIPPLPRPLPAAPAAVSTRVVRLAGGRVGLPHTECLRASVVGVHEVEVHFVPTEEADCSLVAARREVEVDVLLPPIDRDEAEACSAHALHPAMLRSAVPIRLRRSPDSIVYDGNVRAAVRTLPLVRVTRTIHVASPVLISHRPPTSAAANAPS